MVPAKQSFLFLLLLIPLGLFSWGAFAFDIATWHHGGDYGHYFASAVQLRSGLNPYSGTLESVLSSYGFPLGSVEWKATNPPALILVTIPFTFLPPIASFWIWNLFQVLAFVLGARCFFHRFCSTLPTQFLFLSLLGVFCSIPFVMHMRLGQTQLLLAGLIMFGFSFLHRNPKLSAFILGLTASLKLFTLPLFLLSLRRSYLGDKSEKLSFLFFPAGFFAFTLLAELISEGVIIQSFVTEVVPYVGTLQFEIAWAASLAFSLFYLVWWLGYDLNAPPDLSAQIGGWINSATTLLLLFLVAIEFVVTRKSKDLTLSGVFLLLACLLCSPVAWPHYYVLLYPAFLLLFASRAKQPGASSQWLIIVLFVATALTIGFTHIAPVITALWGPSVIIALLALLFLEEKKEASTVSG